MCVSEVIVVNAATDVSIKQPWLRAPSSTIPKAKKKMTIIHERKKSHKPAGL